MLAPEEIARYNRHIIMPEIGIHGQEKLKKAKVLVIGGGGLGCPVLQYLVAAGVGTIGIVDDDTIDESNLQRQIIYNVDEVGQSKAETAAKKLQKQNPFCTFIINNLRLSKDNVFQVFEGFDIVIDGSDNFPTRYLVNDACVILKKPLIFGSIYKFEGQVSVFNFQEGPTYRCLFPEPPQDAPNCSTIGVIGVLPGIIGCIQANEAIKIIIGIGKPLVGRLMVFDALNMSFQEIYFDAIDENKEIKELGNYDFDTCSTDFVVNEILVSELKKKIDNKEDIQIIDVRETSEYDLCNLNGVLIPLSEILDNADKIDKNKPVVIHCYKGSRSKNAILLLHEKYGFTNLLNLKGGIFEWAKEIDDSMNIY